MSLIAAFNKAAPAITKSGVFQMLEKRGFAAMATGMSNTATLNGQKPKINQALSGSMGGVRHGGASAIATGVAIAGIGGVATGVGNVFAALVVGTARNPAVKDDLFAYTMIGFGMVEVMMIIIVVFAALLFTSE